VVSHRIEAALLLCSRNACTVVVLASCARLAAIAGLPLLTNVRYWWLEDAGSLLHNKEVVGIVL
jgi:hypothetical protein